ncbi:uncharacterized protein ACWYII_024248 isoform 2-T2 [Salvelinus alpinus]
MRASRATMDLQSPPDVMRGQPGPSGPPVPPIRGKEQSGLSGPPGPPRPLVASTPDQPTFVVSSGYPAMETFLGLHVLPGPPGPPGPALAGSVGPITDNLAQAMLVSDVSPKNVVVCLVFDDIPRHPGDIGHLQLYEHFK